MSSVGSFRFNGLVIFGSRMASILTGFLFIFMVTGWLSQGRFGLWELITDVVTFAAYPAGLFAFWASRDIARGNLLGRTAILINIGMAAAGLGIFGFVWLLLPAQFSSAPTAMLFAVLLVPLTYWNQAVASIAIGYKPAVMGYSLLISETAKLVVAYPALYIYHLDISGVILAMIAAYFVQSLVITLWVRGAILPQVDMSAGRRWLSGIWIPALYLIPTQIGIADTFVASLAAGSTVVTGDYQAAFTLGSLVANAGLLASALYPFLLRGGSAKAPSLTLDLVLMFAIPMTAGLAVLSPQLLGLLSRVYVTGVSNVTLAVVLLATWGLLIALSTFADQTLMGLETADLKAGTKLRGYLSSNFVFIAKVNIGYLGAILASIFAFILWATSMGLPLSQTVQGWAAIQVLFVVPALLLKLRRLGPRANLGIPPALGKYVLSAALLVVVLFFVAQAAPPAWSFRSWVGGEWIAGEVVLGAGVYFGSLLLVDAQARSLARTFLNLRPRAVDVKTAGPSTDIASRVPRSESPGQRSEQGSS